MRFYRGNKKVEALAYALQLYFQALTVIISSKMSHIAPHTNYRTEQTAPEGGCVVILTKESNGKKIVFVVHVYLFIFI